MRQALDIAIQVAQALAAAHAAGVVHRDLKPENVMVRADGYVKVLDFGLAKLTGPAPLAHGDRRGDPRALETDEGVVMGTVSYMAPEQARGEDTDARADLFALGVLLYEMLAGDAAVQGADHGRRHRRAALPGAARHSRDVPDELDRIVLTALRKDRDGALSDRARSCSRICARSLRTLDVGDRASIASRLRCDPTQTRHLTPGRC